MQIWPNTDIFNSKKVEANTSIRVSEAKNRDHQALLKNNQNQQQHDLSSHEPEYSGERIEHLEQAGRILQLAKEDCDKGSFNYIT